MAYLTLNKPLDMNKVTISFWFRVPTASAKLVRSITPGFFWDYRVFLGVIPLLTWGQQQTATIYGIETYDSGSDAAGVPGAPYRPIMLQTVTAPHSAPMPMSSIGVCVTLETPTLDVHIQTKDHASGTGLVKIPTSFTGTTAEAPDGYPRPLYIEDTIEFIYTDVSYTVTASPDYLGNSSANVSSSGAGTPSVTLDEWHHLLISWELIHHTNMAGASKMWCAIDDENKTGDDLPAMNDPSWMAPNDQMAWVPWQWARDSSASAEINFTSIPADVMRIPGPASVTYAIDDRGGSSSKEPVYVVEMAELQIFTGIALDTSIEANRRAFIDFPGPHTVLTSTAATGAGMKPVDPAKAEKFMHQRPDVLLHGNTNWQKGKNTGSVGQDSTGKPLPSGQFSPVGTISKYKPEPQLGV